MESRFHLGLLLCLIAIAFYPSFAQDRSQTQPSTGTDTSPADDAKGAADLDLEQLANMDVKVTSASKKSEKLSDAPAAIYVLSGEAIRRGGFTSIPDALRTVPGLYVAQEDSHSWVVVARGFGTAFNDKMLVLQDGRLLYQPLFGGVYWDTIDPPLEDIDRIEIIRGPGGTLWGANAVNGVINIITKSSQDTQGTQVATSAGFYERYKAGVRYGGAWGKKLTYRIFGQAMYGEPSVDASGNLESNFWNFNQAGFKADWVRSAHDTFSVEGQGYRGAVETTELSFSGPSSPSPIELQRDVVMQGGDILGRWTHNISSQSALDLLAYCDWFDRFDILGGDIRNTCDIEIQHNYSFSPRHSILWGGSFLSTADTPPHLFEITYTPLQRRANTFAAFGQYEVSMVPHKLRLVTGVKLEHNAYTGFEIQPQFRVVWTPAKSTTIWGSVARAVREPTQLNTDTDFKISETSGGPLPVFATVVGNPALKSEVLRAFELGYRRQFNPSLSLDVAAFYNDYSELIVAGRPDNPKFFPDYIEIPLPFENLGGGQTHGLELAADWRPTRPWSLSAAITETRGASVVGAMAASNTPRHMMNVQSRFDLGSHLEFDSAYYYYDAIPAIATPTLNRFDIGLSTRRTAGFTFAVWGRNLQSGHHEENNSTEPYFPVGEVRRAIVLKLMWQSASK